MELVLGIIGGGASVCAIVFGFIAWRNGKDKSSHVEGENKGVMLTEIGYIKGGVDDIKRKQESFEQNHLEVVQRLSVVESSAKSAHKRIDDLEERI